MSYDRWLRDDAPEGSRNKLRKRKCTLRETGNNSWMMMALASMSLAGILAIQVALLSMRVLTTPSMTVQDTVVVQSLPTSVPTQASARSTATVVATPLTGSFLTPSPTFTAKPAIYHLPVNAAQNLPGLDTEIDVTVGEQLSITTQGWASSRVQGMSCNGTALTNPNGLPLVSASSCFPKMSTSAVLSSAPLGELIAGIRPSGATVPKQWFAVGSSFSGKIQTSGRLFLLYNDNPGNYGENSGSYQVTIMLASS